MNKYILIALLFLLLTSVSNTFAQSKVDSENYQIKFPDLDSGVGVPTSDDTKLGSSVGRTSVGIFATDGYRVVPGFQYMESVIPFSFSISSVSINLGSLVPNSPSLVESLLVVKTGGASGYSLKAEEDHPLTSEDGSNTIPDTMCDTGNCTQTLAQLWEQDSTYGFGFSISGDDIPVDFIDSSHFRQFSDMSLSEKPAIIMSKTKVINSSSPNPWPWESQAIITYKVNISTRQPVGAYQNTITYTAMPSY